MTRVKKPRQRAPRRTREVVMQEAAEIAAQATPASEELRGQIRLIFNSAEAAADQRAA